MDPAISELIVTLLPVVLPLLGVSGYAGHKAIKQKQINDEQIHINNMTQYKYTMMVSFVKTVSDCLEDGSITPKETRLIAAQLKNILGDDKPEKVNMDSFTKGGVM